MKQEIGLLLRKGTNQWQVPSQWGSKVKIIGIDPVRGYAIEDEHGNKMYEIGWEI